MIERAGQSCAIGSALEPYIREGQRPGAFRFGDVRAMALAGALCCVTDAVTGFTNQRLRGLVAGLLGTEYSTSQMSYDLRRLRLHGLIARIPRTNTYTLSPEGQRVAVFYTKLDRHLLHRLLDANHPPAPPELRRALLTIDHAITDYVVTARLGTAAWTLSQRPELGPPSRTRGGTRTPGQQQSGYWRRGAVRWLARQPVVVGEIPGGSDVAQERKAVGR
jgi:hypothetical protein